MAVQRLFISVCLLCFDSLRLADTRGCNQNSSRPPCDQLCTVQSDEYICSCKDGYTLNRKENTCEIEGDAPVLFYQKDTSIAVLYMDTGDSAHVMDNIVNVDKMEFGPNNTLYWIDGHTAEVNCISFDGDYRGFNVRVVIDSGLVSPNGIAVDWITSVLYVLDTSRGQIIACSTKGENCSIIVNDAAHPQSLAIHRQNRKLMWINSGKKVKTGTISMADLNGQGHVVLLGGLQSPHSLIIDETINALFWISDHMVEMMYLKKRQITSVVKIKESGQSGLSVLGNYIYLSNPDEVLKIDKFNGTTVKTFDVQQLVIARVYHLVLYQTKSTKNPCEKSKCSHLCLPSSNRALHYTCHCPLYMNHVSETQCDDRTGQSRLLVSSIAGIFELPVEFIGRSELEVRKLTNQNAECLTYDSVGEQILFYDSQQSAILSFDLSSTIKTMFSDVYHLEALAINQMDNFLYWTTLEGKLHSVSITEGSTPAILYEGFNNPRGMAVDGRKGWIYLCDWGQDPQIMRCSVAGTQCEMILKVPDGHPNMIALENGHQLYWTDSKADRIGSLNLNNNKTTEMRLSGEINHHPVDIVTNDNRIYYTDWNMGGLHYIDKTNPTVIHMLQLNRGTLFGLVLISTVSSDTLHVHGSLMHYGKTNKLPPVKDNIIRVKKPTIPPMIIEVNNFTASNETGHRTNLDVVKAQAGMDVGLILLILFLVACASLLVAILTWLFYCKRNQSKDGIMVKLVKFVKPGREQDDGEGLLQSAYITCDPSFKHFDDIDYPDPSKCRDKYDISMNRRKQYVSMVSTDSAFNEMQEVPPALCLMDEYSE